MKAVDSGLLAVTVPLAVVGAAVKLRSLFRFFNKVQQVPYKLLLLLIQQTKVFFASVFDHFLDAFLNGCQHFIVLLHFRRELTVPKPLQINLNIVPIEQLLHDIVCLLPHPDVLAALVRYPLLREALYELPQVLLDVLHGDLERPLDIIKPLRIVLDLAQGVLVFDPN